MEYAKVVWFSHNKMDMSKTENRKCNNQDIPQADGPIIQKGLKSCSLSLEERGGMITPLRRMMRVDRIDRDVCKK